MAEADIRNIGVRPTGDDQAWKAEVERVLRELIASNTSLRTRVDATEKRVN